MKYNVDKFSIKSHLHEQNQDYALIHADEESGILTISDGCSSGQNTSIGSRLMCLMAMRYANKPHMATLTNDRNLEPHLTDGCDSLLNNPFLSLEKEDLLATVGLLLKRGVTTTGVFYGDGAILREKENEAELVTIEYQNNMPLYPVYNTLRYRQHFTAIGSRLPKFKGKTSTYTRDSSGTWSLTASRNLHENGPIFNLFKPSKSIHLITDGIHQFVDTTTGVLLPATEIADEILALKSRDGAFMQRRMKRMLFNLEKRNIKPADDFTIVSLIDENYADSNQ